MSEEMDIDSSEGEYKEDEEETKERESDSDEPAIKKSVASKKQSAGSSKNKVVLRNVKFSQKDTSPASRIRAATPWVEKYRPKTVEDVAHQEEVVRALQKSIETGNLPHLLFYGPPGTGKTSTILAIGHALYGPLFRERVMELNASDERGINVVRTKIKNFAQIATSSGTPPGSEVGSTRNYPCPPYKLIILDEADSMTGDAQAALRRIIETYTSVTLFCLICNYISRIIDPLSSRCAKFRFKPLTGETMRTRLRSIAEAESVEISDEAVDSILEISDGDLRRAITFLQSAHSLATPAVKGGEEDEKKMKIKVGVEDIVGITGVVPKKSVMMIVDACKTKVWENMQTSVTAVLSEGYSGVQVMYQLYEMVVVQGCGGKGRDGKLGSKERAEIALRIAEADRRMNDGADELLQLLDVCAHMMHIFPL